MFYKGIQILQRKLAAKAFNQKLDLAIKFEIIDYLFTNCLVVDYFLRFCWTWVTFSFFHCSRNKTEGTLQTGSAMVRWILS